MCCKEAVQALDTEHERDAFLANVDVGAAEAFVTAPEKITLAEMHDHLLNATHTYYNLLAAVAEPTMPQTLDTHVQWVVFKCAEENKKTPAPVTESRILPKIITFDESTGSALTAQYAISETKAEASTPQLRLPWRAWHAHASGLGRQEAAMRCALQVLHMLHEN